MPWKRKQRSRTYNLWQKLCFATIGLTLLVFIAIIVIGHSSDADPPVQWIFLCCCLSVFFGTTGAIKKGSFHAKFTTYTREHTPIPFWTSAILGYTLSTALAICFTMELMS